MSCSGMKKAISATIGGLLWLALSLTASATTMTIESQNFAVGDGGGFLADLNSMAADSFDVYCADYRNYIPGYNNSYPVNISTPATGLDDTVYGTTTTFAYNSIVAGTLSRAGDEFGNAYDRYVMAGWLTTQYDLSNTSDPINQGIQDAIWTLLNVDGQSFTSADSAADLQAAVNFMNGNPTGFTQIAKEEVIYTSTNVAGDNDLNPADCDTNSRYSIGTQEMIAVNTTPEPAVFAMVGGGLLLIGVIRRRKTK